MNKVNSCAVEATNQVILPAMPTQTMATGGLDAMVESLDRIT